MWLCHLHCIEGYNIYLVAQIRPEVHFYKSSWLLVSTDKLTCHDFPWATVCIVHCAVYSIQCTVYILQCTVYILRCTVYSLQLTVYIQQCTLNNLQCTACNVQCTVYNVQCTACSAIIYQVLLIRAHAPGVHWNIAPHTLQCTTPHCTSLQYTTIHWTAVHYIALQSSTLHNTALHYTTLKCTALHYSVFQSSTVKCSAVQDSLCRLFPPSQFLSVALHRKWPLNWNWFGWSSV